MKQLRMSCLRIKNHPIYSSSSIFALRYVFRDDNYGVQRPWKSGERYRGGEKKGIPFWKSTDQIVRIKLSDFIRTTLGARADIDRYLSKHRSLAWLDSTRREKDVCFLL